jgi:hypothetical protein
LWNRNFSPWKIQESYWKEYRIWNYYKINDILTGQGKCFDGLPEDLTINDIAYFKYAPLTSTNVERSFSRYKNLLAPNRRAFEFENLKHTLIVQCNKV